jgi:formate hydrogenlyase transcriptional activator
VGASDASPDFAILHTQVLGNIHTMTPGGQNSDLPWQAVDLRQVIDSAPALIHTARPDGHLDFFNQRWLDFVGLSQSDLLGWQWTACIHPEDVEVFVEKWRTSVATGEPFEEESRVRRADGQYRWMIHQKDAFRDQDGAIVKWFGSSIDIEDRKRAEVSLQRALDEIKTLRDQLFRENIALRDEIDKASMFEEIVGASAALNAVLARVAKVAPTDSTVLVTGETGTGKELIARAIHKRSRRSARAFVSVNCAAVPRDLIASELFGHEKGAFTGATQRRLGRFELAEGGTIFLDEIGELPPETQVALLRVLQEREFERVGGNANIRAEVRVIAATNRDLEAAVTAGTFRSDLFYRLHVFPIEIPPLRERREDIPLLVEYFIDRYARKTGRVFRRISKRSLELLQAYPWPGNIRELQNVIERSVIVCESENFSIDESWLSRQPRAAESKERAELAQKVAAQEKEMIENALKVSGGRVFGPLGAAVRLGIPRSTLESKIRSLKIDKNRFKSLKS